MKYSLHIYPKSETPPTIIDNVKVNPNIKKRVIRRGINNTPDIIELRNDVKITDESEMENLIFDHEIGRYTIQCTNEKGEIYFVMEDCYFLPYKNDKILTLMGNNYNDGKRNIIQE